MTDAMTPMRALTIGLFEAIRTLDPGGKRLDTAAEALALARLALEQMPEGWAVSESNDPTGAAWHRLERALRRAHLWTVRVGYPVGPLPYRARTEHTYIPVGKKNRRTERIDGEGPTVAAALDALSAELETRSLD